jgi:hypothetical protein
MPGIDSCYIDALILEPFDASCIEKPLNLQICVHSTLRMRKASSQSSARVFFRGRCEHYCSVVKIDDDRLQRRDLDDEDVGRYVVLRCKYATGLQLSLPNIVDLIQYGALQVMLHSVN